MKEKISPDGSFKETVKSQYLLINFRSLHGGVNTQILISSSHSLYTFFYLSIHK